MPIVDSQAEETIKETARRIFLAQGRFDATTQDIAKEAGVNRGLLYYYFKNRDHLFEVILKEAVMVGRNKLHELFLAKNVSFQAKISAFIDLTIDQNMKYPYLEMFLITNSNMGGKMLKAMSSDTSPQLIHEIGKGLKDEIKKGYVPEMSVEQFMTNILSLCGYPHVYKPLLRQMIGFSEEEYHKMMQERKSLIMKVLFRD